MMRAVIIGTGPAGITAAQTLRELDHSIEITALSAEPYAPYSPAAMADHFLTGRTDTLYWKGADIAQRLGVEERRDVVVSTIDTDGREVHLTNGERLGYDGLIIASGSRLHSPLDGADLEGVLDFKSMRMAEQMVARVRRGDAHSAVIVGHGLIGIELSLLLSDLGVDVTVIGRRPWIMPRVLDPETSKIAERELLARGVTLQLGVEAKAFVGSPMVNAVELADGRRFSGDLIVAATGVKPHVEFLDGTDVTAAWGIHVDDQLRTSVPGVFAAGDVAEAADWMTGERYVHAIFPNAVNQARIAAANLLGASRTYDGAESMNSLKHLGIPIVAMGTIDDPDDILRWRSGSSLRSLYLRENRIIGVQLAGDIRGAGVYRSLMMRRCDVRPFVRRLVEPGFGVADEVFA